jgi:hypothetical protein
VLAYRQAAGLLCRGQHAADKGLRAEVGTPIPDPTYSDPKLIIWAHNV